MISRINILNIVLSHIKTFRNHKKRTIDYWGITFMFILPAFVVYYLSRYETLFVNAHIAEILTFVSITGGFLFNLLALIFSVTEKIRQEEANAVRKIFAKEIHANISFGILIAIISALSLLMYLFPTPFFGLEPFLSNATLFFIYYILIVFILNLFLLLKKIFILLDNQ